MASVTAMAKSSYSLYNSGIGSSNASSSMWQTYSSSAQSSANVLSGLIGISSSKAELVNTYEKAQKEFNSEFSANMSSLKSSTNALKKIDFAEIAKDKNAITTETDEEGVKTTKYSDAMSSALKSVKDFVSDYNDSVNFLKENSEVSSRVKSLSTSFGDTTYRAESLSKIGITVASDGTMKIDEEKLAKSIAESPEKVSGLLGENGLAGKAESHVDFAQSQQNKLFPSISSTLGDDFKNTAMYSGQSLLRISSYASMGNFLNMMA